MKNVYRVGKCRFTVVKLWVRETQFYYYLFMSVLFSIETPAQCKPALAHPCILAHFGSAWDQRYCCTVLINFSQIKGTWHFHEPLQPNQGERYISVSSNTACRLLPTPPDVGSSEWRPHSANIPCVHGDEWGWPFFTGGLPLVQAGLSRAGRQLSPSGRSLTSANVSVSLWQS